MKYTILFFICFTIGLANAQNVHPIGKQDTTETERVLIPLFLKLGWNRMAATTTDKMPTLIIREGGLEYQKGELLVYEGENRDTFIFRDIQLHQIGLGEYWGADDFGAIHIHSLEKWFSVHLFDHRMTSVKFFNDRPETEQP